MKTILVIVTLLIIQNSLKASESKHCLKTINVELADMVDFGNDEIFKDAKSVTRFKKCVCDIKNDKAGYELDMSEAVELCENKL